MSDDEFDDYDSINLLLPFESLIKPVYCALDEGKYIIIIITSQNPGCNSRHTGLSSHHPGCNKKHQAKMQSC